MGEGAAGVREVCTAALCFPAFFFSVALVVVAAFWLLVLCGAADVHGFDGDLPLGAVGLGGLPVSVAVSAMAVAGWCAALAGTVALGRLTGPGVVRSGLSLVVLVAALVVAHGAARLLAGRWWPPRARFPSAGAGAEAARPGTARPGAGPG
ncbi:hypothetical protein J116_012340 [Streptomyces thermolilacinus SPC6]|uniref:Uncharacterized protein n=1 Tax=Streptomyces thermolilacinus SPC6 TaxID=1306406 RepID=A0A1D3DS79_9ACTN|nr:hypothetical protein J116_012340 [Streptomyces thermolilacinus SPC6]